MKKFFATALAAIMAFTVATNAPTQAHAGTKERALVTGLVVGAAAAAAVYMKSKAKKAYRVATSKVYPNDDCGPGYRMKRGRCVLRDGGFRGGKKFGRKFRSHKKYRFGKKFRSGKKFHFSKKFRTYKKYKVANSKKRPSWQIQAIRKGCKPGLAWNKYEGCHEND